MWYGVSSIAARFINYILTPIITYSSIIKTSDYGIMSSAYAAIPILNVIFTYGMETTYFRFIQKKEREQSVNNVATISLLFSTVLFSVLLWLNQSSLARLASLQNFPLLVQLCIVIIGMEALTAIPFARLRNEGRPHLFAFIKVAGIFINILVTVFFISYCPHKLQEDPNSWIILLYKTDINPITYILVANVIQSTFTLVLLSKWLVPKKWQFDIALWKEMMVYALPMLVAGMGGMINETFDRLMLGWWLPGSSEYVHSQVGIYSACYKLSILISLFIQAFRMGAEPFFFKQAEGQNPQAVYARVMKFFVITITLMFLVVSLFLPIWRGFIKSTYWEGLGVVPILLLANMSLGIYYNLSVWYKVSNNTMAGAYITLIGTAITCLINWFFIPHFSYMACAWATFLCYFSMMVISFSWGQKKYYIPYAWKKLLAYLVMVVLLFFLHKGITAFYDHTVFSLAIATLLTSAYLLFVVRVEKKEFQQLPFVGRFIR